MIVNETGKATQSWGAGETTAETTVTTTARNRPAAAAPATPTPTGYSNGAAGANASSASPTSTSAPAPAVQLGAVTAPISEGLWGNGERRQTGYLLAMTAPVDELALIVGAFQP